MINRERGAAVGELILFDTHVPLKHLHIVVRKYLLKFDDSKKKDLGKRL